MIQIVKKENYAGRIVIPSSKSDCQRAVLAAGLSKGTTVLHGVGASNDEQQMLRNIQQLGAVVNELSDDRIEVKGIQQFPEKVTLSAGESGLGVRLITSVCAAHSGAFTIEGEGSLLVRPQTFFQDHLPQMGVKVESNEGKLPMVIHGPLKGGEMNVDGSMSSQFLSGLLMALPLIENDSILNVKDLKSVPYAEMTVATLRAFGIHFENDAFETIKISGGQQYDCGDEYRIDADWSSASYWLVAAALGFDIEIEALNLESLQADKALLEAFKAADCNILIDEDGSICINGTQRKAFKFDATDCPDLFPAIVSLAAFCEGTTIVSGVHRLKNKESDRGVVLQKEFAKLGLQIDLLGDEMHIHGGTKLHGAKVDANNDHRIAMCLGIAGMMLSDGVEISGAESVAKSYPAFWDHLNSLRK